MSFKYADRLIGEFRLKFVKDDPIGIMLPLNVHFEQFYADPYLCPSKKWTIGYGHVLQPGDPRHLTEPEAMRLLKAELMLNYYPGAMRALRRRGVDTKTLAPHQKAAVLSFAYNCGIGAINGDRQASWPAHLITSDFDRARSSWLAWHNGDAGPLPGLVRRRFAEWQLFTTGTWDEQPNGWRAYYEEYRRKNGG